MKTLTIILSLVVYSCTSYKPLRMSSAPLLEEVIIKEENEPSNKRVKGDGLFAVAKPNLAKDSVIVIVENNTSDTSYIFSTIFNSTLSH